jgi:collagenase-like PrtC family protease
MCEEKLKVLKLKGLKASHPRVAGIVQAHRQQIDAAGAGQQQMSEKDI